MDVHPHRDAGDDDVRPVPQLPGEDQVDVVVQEPVTLAEAVDAEEWFDMIAELPAEYSGLIPERSAGDEERPGPGSGDPGRGRCSGLRAERAATTSPGWLDAPDRYSQRKKRCARKAETRSSSLMIWVR